MKSPELFLPKILKVRAECAKIIQEGIGKNVFNNVDVQYTATMIVAFIQGLIIQYIIDNEAFDYTEYSKKMKSQIVDNLMK